MAVLKFRVYLEEDDAVYRDVLIKHTQTFADLHSVILKAYEFDNKHAATFYRSNENRQRGREISFEKYDKPYVAPPLLMSETKIGSEIQTTDQKFIYVYDFQKNWTFWVDLIQVIKEVNPKLEYPCVSRKEGLAPQQYGIKSLLGSKFAAPETEEKYDLSEGADGFSEEGENIGNVDNSDEEGEDVVEGGSGEDEI
jgi:hypothetical protein